MSNEEKKARILIVGDVWANVKTLLQILRSDYDLYAATSGQKALLMAANDIPDLILLDVIMADMDGYEVCEKLKAKEKIRNIPVIFIDAQDKVEDEAKGFALGAVDYIWKPFSSHVVQARVRNHLRLQQTQKSAEAANLANNRFLANSADVIRTQINTIIGMTEVVLATVLDQNQRTCLRNVVASGKTLLDLVNDILDLSKIEHGKMHLQSTVPTPLAILVADDVQTIRALVTIRLEQCDHRVTVVEDGLQVLAACEKQTFDLILMDVHMPNLDGVAATKEIRKQEAERESQFHMPIIALTANSTASEMERCLAAGMDYFVSKPIDFDALFGVLQQLFPSAIARADHVIKELSAMSELAVLPTLDGVDVVSGMAQWQSVEGFRQSLLAFSRDHADDVEKISANIHAGNIKAAKVIVHTLKGAAGNLATTKLAAAVTQLDAALNCQDAVLNCYDADLEVSIRIMANALDEVVNSCASLASRTTAGDVNATAQVVSIGSHHIDILCNLAHALDYGESLAAEKWLPELARWLRGTTYEAVVKVLVDQIEDFRCIEARQTVTNIAELLGIDLHGHESQ